MGDPGDDGEVVVVGASARVDFTVTDADTALAVGSGDLPVLGTPRLLAWCEVATCVAVSAPLGASRTSVGTEIRLEHLAPSPVGARVCVTASLVYVEGRQLHFEVQATHAEDGSVIGQGEVRRAVVDRERFLSRIRGHAR